MLISIEIYRTCDFQGVLVRTPYLPSGLCMLSMQIISKHCLCGNNLDECRAMEWVMPGLPNLRNPMVLSPLGSLAPLACEDGVTQDALKMLCDCLLSKLQTAMYCRASQE